VTKTTNTVSHAALVPPFGRLPSGELHCEGLPLCEIAAQFGTPTFVYSARAITQAYQAFAHAAAPFGAMVCYALKANSNLALIDHLSRLGAGFDIVSEGELRRVLAVGGDPQKIVFSGVGKTHHELRSALLAGIRCLNVESTAELDMIAQVAAELGVQAPVSLRVNPDIDPKTHPYISTGLKENKFGIPMQHAVNAYRHAQSLPSIRICGIDCHIGSQITTLQPFLDSLEKVLLLAQELSQHGIELDHLDLGGGLGIAYDQETPPSPGTLMNALLSRVAAWAADTGRKPPQVFFEFGRAIVGNAGILLSRVEILKPGEDKNFAVIDAAMNDLMRPTLYNAWHDVALVKPAVAAPKTWDLVGPVCESGDWIAKDRVLGLAAGDLVAILSAGAYGMSMSSNYNSRGRAAEVLISEDGQAHLIRRREAFEDLIATERVPHPK
jgi:diaminopimelate decarboxylase